MAFAVAALNVAYLALVGSYDFRLGPVHLVATYLFKPLLYLNAAFLVAIAVNSRSRTDTPTPEPISNRAFVAAAIALTVAIYGLSFGINLHYPDWTHRDATTGRSIVSFFVQPQYDGFYRPLSFLSLWLDNQVFGERLWGYHIQSILLHVLNGFLVARLAVRLGFEVSWARLAGLMFIALPAAFEAVIWAGARFDLLAAAFTLLALERALAGSIVVSVTAYAAGVLCKESAYCYLPLLGALYLLRHPLGLTMDRVRKTFAVATLVTLAFVGIRFAVYGNFGGYPGPETGRPVQFELTARTFTSLPTRIPASLYIVNSAPGLTWWMSVALLVYVGTLAIAVFRRASLGNRAALLVFPFLAAIPTLNMIAWLNHFAQQSRYVYQPGIWILLAVACALSSIHRATILAIALIASMGTAALFNSWAYIRMLRAVDLTVDSAVTACHAASCCRTLALPDLARDLDGAFYFGYEVRHRLQERLPEVNILVPGGLTTSDPCLVRAPFPDAAYRGSYRIRNPSQSEP